MRKLVLLGVALVACAKSDTPKADTASSTGPVAATTPAAPAKLTAADLAGTWNGTTTAATSDSVLNHWTSVETSDSTGKLTVQGMKDPIAFSFHLDGDSMIVTTAPYVSPQMRKGPKVVNHSVGRLQNGTLVGTATITLAAKPDSVVAHSRWTATKAP
jgi:hypothetical protein